MMVHSRRVLIEQAPARFRCLPKPPLVLLPIATLALLATLGPVIWGQDALSHDVTARLQGPSLAHPAGTDGYGRDLLARLLLGARWTVLGATLVSVAISVIGLFVAAMATGHRLLDLTLGRLIDALLAVPGLVTALALTSILGPSFRNLLLALTVTGWPWYARVYRGVLLRELSSGYVESAIVAGMSRRRLLARHVLPNMIGPIIVMASANLGAIMLNLAALSFLGLGVQPPIPEWGAMINESRIYLQQRPWQVLAPGLCITLAVLTVNLTGDALRDAFDPRLRHLA
jgi:peptide/nickel transport system permease protein